MQTLECHLGLVACGASLEFTLYQYLHGVCHHGAMCRLQPSVSTMLWGQGTHAFHLLCLLHVEVQQRFEELDEWSSEQQSPVLLRERENHNKNHKCMLWFLERAQVVTL